MATFVPAKRATQYITFVGLVDQANTKLLKSSATIAAGDFKVSIDGGALANLGTLPTVTPAASKMVKITLSVAEMTGDNITVVASDAAGAEWCDLEINLQTAARQIDDLAYPATSGRSMVVDAAGLVDANAVKVGPTGAGTAQTAGDVIGDTNDIQARLPAALVSGRMDSSTGAMAANVMTAAAAAADLTTELQAGLATWAAWATVKPDTDDIQARPPAALVGGPIDSSVGAMAADTLTASALAADAVTEIQSGLALDAPVAKAATVSGETAAIQADTDNIQTRLPFALVGGKMDSTDSDFTTAVSDPAALAGAMPATVTRLVKMDWIFSRLFRKKTFNKITGDHKVYNASDAVIATHVASDDGPTTDDTQAGAP